jgi:hypothetical protein
MEQEKEWIEKYLADPADIFTGRCVPEATGLLDKLVAEAEARGRKKGVEECVEAIKAIKHSKPE